MLRLKKEGGRKMEEKRNANKGLIFIIVILLIGLLGTTGFIIYDKFITKEEVKDEKMKEENEEKVEKEESEIVDINSDLVQNLYSIFRFDRSCYMTADDLNNNNLVKLRLAYENIAKLDMEPIECSKLELSDLGYCGIEMNYLMEEAYMANDMVKFKEYEQLNYTDSLRETLMTAKVHELFGSDTIVKHESFGTGHIVDANCNFMKYDATNHLYAQFSCEGGGICSGRSQELISASKEKDKLYIVTKLSYPSDNTTTTVTYTFKTDSINNNYVFENVVEQ